MDLLIKHDAFAGRGLTLRTGGFFKGPRLMIDGGEVKGKRLRFAVRDNSGKQREIRLKTNGFDPVPKVHIGDQTIELARPLTWYEYVWMAIPIALVFVGGGLGALFGIAAVYSSARIFRSDRGTAAKYGLSALISLGAALAYLVCALVVQLLLGSPSKG
jgi:hypothetical protein